MPFTTNPITQASSVCYKIWGSLGQTNGTHIVYVPDGTIFAETPNGDGTYTTYEINKTCCNILKEKLVKDGSTTLNGASANDIYFDLDEQKCRWSSTTTDACDKTENSPIKVVLNPDGNDGVLFTYGDDDVCRLDINFDYLIKFDCNKLFKFATLTNKSATDPELKGLRQKKFELESVMLDIDNQINGLALEDVKTTYSIVCNEFPVIENAKTTEPIVPLTEKEKSVFSDSGFGSLVSPTSISLKSTPVYNTKSVTFCLTDAGLIIWEKIINDVNYIKFLNGDPNSYTCNNVIEIYKLNEEAILNNQDILIYECTTPFGYKTESTKTINTLIDKKKPLLSEVTIINERIAAIEGTTNTCDTLLGQFQNIKLSVSLDIVNNDGSTERKWFIEPIFGGFDNASNLFDYLESHQNNSGFLLCGDNSSGCTPMIISEYTGVTESSPINSNRCELIKDTLISQLSSAGNGTLSPNIFNSEWISFSGSVTDPAVLSGITGHKIKLNIIVNNSCGDFCILVDNIDITRVCNDINRTSIYIGQSPGFELTKVIDNKKSWLEATDYVDRQFYIGRYDDTNKIRQTEYSVDEERLVLNSKEIDLTMNMASAVENDVWCYLLDNPNLLTGQTCSSTNSFTPTDILGNLIILPTAQTYTYNVSDLIKSANEYFRLCSYGKEVYKIKNSCYPQVECSLCGTALKIETNRGNESLWITCDDFNGLGAYYISNDNDAQQTIYNISYSLTGSSLSDLTSFVNKLNINLPSNQEPYQIFWDDLGNCISCCKDCGDESINFSGFISTNISEINTLETFENFMVSELTDAKNRKVLSAYPTLRAVYDRYMNATQYGVPQSHEFTYDKMDKFTGLIKNYWDDLIEQVVPATTIWGDVKVYTNTMFDQQKFKYRSYTSLFCNNPLNFATPPSPINGSVGQCKDVEVLVTKITNLTNLPEGAVVRMNKPTKYNNICVSQMNWGSEFLGNVDIQDGNGNYLNNNTFCDNLCKKAVWYSMPESPESMMRMIECNIYPNTATSFSIESFVINGNNLITTPLSSDTINNQNIIWVQAQNDVISGCTLGNSTGWTYTNFVDFLNYVFFTLDISTKYEARLSYKQVDTVTLSDGSILVPKIDNINTTGFYLLFPENDVFELLIHCESNDMYQFKYTNDNLYTGPNLEYEANSRLKFLVDLSVDYDCNTNKINE